MSTPLHHPLNTATQAGLSLPLPPAARQDAGASKFVVVIHSSQFGRVEDPWSTLEEAVEAFESTQRSACFGPADQFGDIVQVELFNTAGDLLRQSPRWS